ncbi:MAG: hypothetical protein ACI853_000575, partial [Paracoccaceae bacterium]
MQIGFAQERAPLRGLAGVWYQKPGRWALKVKESLIY